jgi:hypothetical protein
MKPTTNLESPGHATADNHFVHFLQQVLNDLDLVGYFRATFN